MWVWIEDQRFRCPKCIRLIKLVLFEYSPQSKMTSEMVAVCGFCKRTYTVQDWRELYGSANQYRHIDFDWY